MKLLFPIGLMKQAFWNGSHIREHVFAQQLGRERWHESYSDQVAEIIHEYRVAC